MKTLHTSRIVGTDDNRTNRVAGRGLEPSRPRVQTLLRAFNRFVCPLGALLALALGPVASGQPCLLFDPPQEVGWVQSPELDEVSGLAVSRRRPGVLWVHNDKGGQACVYAIDVSGRFLLRCELYDAKDRDYEDIAIGPGPEPDVDYLYVGNIGDNGEDYSRVYVYRVPEPAVDSNQAPAVVVVTDFDTIKLVYPYGPRDAETLMVDRNGDIYVATKRRPFTEVYRAAYPQSVEEDNTFELVAMLELDWHAPPGVDFLRATGGDISANGGTILLRGYWAAYAWTRGPDQTIAEALQSSPVPVPLPPYEEQGESIGLTRDGSRYYVMSEGLYSPLFEVAVRIPGDMTCDGLVDMRDVARLTEWWGRSECFACGGADLNGDAQVSLPDVLFIAQRWLTRP